MVLFIFSLVFSGNFLKKEEGFKTEGKFWFSLSKIHIEVVQPVNQIVEKKEDTLLIYYPEDNEGFKILTNVYDIPLGLNIFLFPVEEAADTLFSKAGFKFLKKESRNDTVLKTFTYDVDKSTIFLTVGYLKGRPVFFESRSKKKLLNRTKIMSYIELDNTYFPEIIKIKNFTTNEDIEIRFSDVKISDDFPDRIKNFSLPENAKVEIKDLRRK